MLDTYTMDKSMLGLVDDGGRESRAMEVASSMARKRSVLEENPVPIAWGIWDVSISSTDGSCSSMVLAC